MRLSASLAGRALENRRDLAAVHRRGRRGRRADSERPWRRRRGGGGVGDAGGRDAGVALRGRRAEPGPRQLRLGAHLAGQRRVRNPPSPPSAGHGLRCAGHGSRVRLISNMADVIRRERESGKLERRGKRQEGREGEAGCRQATLASQQADIRPPPHMFPSP